MAREDLKFELTAEEVELIKRTIKVYNCLILNDDKRFPELIHVEQKIVNNLLTRIKQWRDENNNT